ncbi:PXA domain-containing protein [Aspergillus pseudoustus]|uniref:PXA domain-containing protein n=1 Tax=Aspergillus pseudoustus TaxID=1810923 RepID=A0ABR4K7K6_9EURO
MTTDPVPLGLHPISHLKAGPTTSSSRSTAIPAPSTTPPPSQLSQRPQLGKNVSRDDLNNATSDKATAALIRRVLCPQSGNFGGATLSSAPEELLPPLTSSNDVDRQLYALIAIIIKEFVYSWYSKITADQSFTNELLQVIAHCTRALEQRLREVDATQLVLDEIPALLEAHIISYRLAKEQSYLSGLSPSTREIYHALNPHPGLSPVPDTSEPQTVSTQRENEAAYRRLLANGVLAVLLPTEDLENACLRTLTNDILSDLILGNEVGGRVCEGWFLWESMAKLLELLAREKNAGHEDKSAEIESSPPNQLQQFGLLSSHNNSETSHTSSITQSQATSWIWSLLQYVFVAYVTLRFIVAGLLRVASTPPVILSSHLGPGSTVDEPLFKRGQMGKRPVLDYRLYGMFSQLLDIPRRMPWLGGLLALFQYLILAGPGRIGDSGGVLDRVLRRKMSRASPHGSHLSRRNRANSRVVEGCERIGCGAGRLWFDLRMMIYEWRWQVPSQTGRFRRVIGRGSMSSGTSMQWIYIARMLHRSLDLLVDALCILRNLQQSPIIRSCRLVLGVTDPDRKIRLYNRARIINTAGERRSPTDPWRFFGINSHFVRVLETVCPQFFWWPLVSHFAL